MSHLQHHGQLIKECIGKCRGWSVCKENGDLLSNLKLGGHVFVGHFTPSKTLSRVLTDETGHGEVIMSLFTELAAMLQEKNKNQTKPKQKTILNSESGAPI